MSDSEGRAAWN